jgi:hypothetical protein
MPKSNINVFTGYFIPGVKSSCVGCEQNMELDDALEVTKNNLDGQEL